MFISYVVEDEIKRLRFESAFLAFRRSIVNNLTEAFYENLTLNERRKALESAIQPDLELLIWETIEAFKEDT